MTAKAAATRWRNSLLIGVALVGLLLIIGLGVQLYRFRERMDLYNKIDSRLRKWQQATPEGISETEWYGLWVSASQAHANFGGGLVPDEEMPWYRKFAGDIQDVSLQDPKQALRWFWKEIEEHSVEGKRYSKRFRPKEL